MIAEKPTWIRHEGMQIFSIDIQPGGQRFATGGGDHKVRIWNMKSVAKDSEGDPPSQKLLATLRDHFGSVNCVRWAKHSRFIASGSDDQVILIHERKPGSGTTEFGSGEPPDVENWKVVMTLRGHTADVVDLNWSPDDQTLASGSLDNTVHIWNMTNGICTAVLRGHSSLVKGVTWDPIGSFIASQSDDKSVIIWRTADWSLAHRLEGHWSKSVGSTFFRRLGWSPCGHFITTAHGFQEPRHSAPVLERGEWSVNFDFLGHNAPVVVVKFNHSMFRKNDSKAAAAAAAAAATTTAANGSVKNNSTKEVQPYNVIAIGSQDRTITVWTTANHRPLFVAKHFFTQSVVDLSWSPDGYALFACSLDGTVATFHFEAKELGYRLSDSELDDLKKNRYGDVRGRQSNLAESPAQLLLEAVEAKQSATKRAAPAVPPASRQQQQQQQQQINLPSKSGQDQNEHSAPKAMETDSQKDGVVGDEAGRAAPAKVPSPVKQREYRRPDGRKRIIPEAVGVPGQQEIVDFSSTGPGQQSKDEALTVSDMVKRPFGGGSESNLTSRERQVTSARATIHESLVVEKKASGPIADEDVVVPHSGPRACGILSVRIFGKDGDDGTGLVRLEAKPIEKAAHDTSGGVGSVFLSKETEICCKRGNQTLWSDRIASSVAVLAGNSNFWAVGCADGWLQVYTKCGRRTMPAMMVGSAPVFIDCDDSWKLLLVTRKGSVYVWDMFNRVCLLQDSLASLVSSPETNPPANGARAIKVISARFSRSGFPLVVLATRHAYLFDMGMKCWLRIADDCFPASNFASSLNLSSVQGGELANLQVDVGKFLARKTSWSRVTDDGMQTRAHLEAQLASALALKSPNEYRQCLLSYIRFLAREADESRLREVCESFIGPPAGMAESTSPVDQNLAWDPFILGMKKHSLLREEILPAMASNRKVQRLLNEFLDILSEYKPSEGPEKKVPPVTVDP